MNKSSSEIILLLVWGIGISVVGVLLAAQSIVATRAGTNPDYIGARVSVVGLLTLPMLGMVIGVFPLKQKHQKLSSIGLWNAVGFSAIYLVGVFLLLWFERRYYPGALMSMFGYWGVSAAALQAYIAWSITRLASR